jgi:hypothetical protein
MMRYRPLPLFAAILMGCLVLSGPSSLSSAATWTPAPVPDGTRVWVGPCTGASDLDCIESVSAVVNGQEVKGTLTGRTGASADGGVASYEWRIPGLINEDGKDLVSSQILLTGANTVKTNLYPSTLVGLGASLFSTPNDGFRPQWDSGLDTCDAVNGRFNGKCVRYGNLQTGTRYSAVVRTSWVAPSLVSSKNADTTVVVEKLDVSGASRLTVSGVPHRILGVDPPQMNSVDSATSRGAWSGRSFEWGVLDGRQFAFLASCYDKSTLMVGDNTWGPSVPTFDKATGALDLKVRNPHFDVDGVTPFTGTYQARIPLESARCLWGDKIASTKQFTVSVLESSSGESKVSTTSITADSTTFIINASGFTFSAPTIRVTATEEAAAAPEPTGTAPVAVPAKPTGVTVKATRGALTASFTRPASVTHKVTAVRGKTTKTLACRNTGTKVTCSVRGLTKGSWKVSIMPRNAAGYGSAYTKVVQVP